MRNAIKPGRRFPMRLDVVQQTEQGKIAIALRATVTKLAVQ